ncbi:Hypothetical protein NocV09_01500730 [Nannochloropsis oceanica]
MALVKICLLAGLVAPLSLVQGFHKPIPRFTVPHRPYHNHRPVSFSSSSLSQVPPPKPSASVYSSRPATSLLSLQAWPQTRDPKPAPADYPLAAARISITVIACLLTSYAHSSADAICSSPVLASAAVTLAGSLISPGLGQAAMCGSFAGMSSSLLLPTFSWTLLTGLVTSVLFEAFIHYRNAALGLGGRLGTIAFVSVNFVSALRGIWVLPALPSSLPPLPTLSTFAASIAAFPDVSVATLASLKTFVASSPYLPLTMGYGVVGALATIALREASDDSAAADPVRAAAVVGLLSALMVGVGGHTSLGALAAYGGAFVGMSLPSRLMYGSQPPLPGSSPSDAAPLTRPTTPRNVLTNFAIAGLLGGLVHGLTLHWGMWTTPVAAWGGKAGFCAFVGVLLHRGMLRGLDGLEKLGRKLMRSVAGKEK